MRSRRRRGGAKTLARRKREKRERGGGGGAGIKGQAAGETEPLGRWALYGPFRWARELGVAARPVCLSGSGLAWLGRGLVGWAGHWWMGLRAQEVEPAMRHGVCSV